MRRIAIITARGGSKRILRKNVKPFLGKPIMCYSIEAAKQAGVFEEIMVSTDDEEIAEIARKNGATVPFMRSERTANDFATTAEVMGEVLDAYQKKGRKFDQACCIYPTAPFLTGSRIKEAMELMTKEDADSVIPVVQFSFPPQRCVIIKNGRIEPKWPNQINKRSQDLEPFYHDCGQFYAVEISSFLVQRKMIMEKTVPIILSEMEVQDIDTLEDWKIAELKYQIRENL